ncbi:hypothetical protein ABU162_29920 [Paenibacillus thiaminolyticus]|uniref:hypothetical protein n=2 Tax=Paenibacillus TaxID=44249 RepID=UPI001059C13B|nr:hypothetical protein [Paenibacillus dendritiformis]NKI23575.1 hypothetical protein [Paenibacillus dendritiformis]NRG00900.1 hypothetical protein [Paenibacillus dendritiformis]TDL57678.1 hypothetical protein E2R60_04060 [Paenibacillus dendritiformis]
MKILNIEYPSYYDSLDKENGNMDIFVKLNDGMIYTMVVTTPNNYYWYMDKEGLDYIPASPPDIIVRSLNKEVVEKAIQTYIQDNAYWLKLYFLAGESNGVFDEKQMDMMIQEIKKSKEEIFGSE